MDIENNNSQENGLKNITWITYIAFVVGLFTGGLAFLVGMIIAYVKRGEAVGTIYGSHLNYLISTAWWTLLWSFIGALTIFIIIGIPILIGAGIWFIYRLVKGILRLADGKPVH